MKSILKDYKFEDMFSKVILDRGKRYYENDSILDIWTENNKVKAYVDGTEIYRVVLETRGNKLTKYSCSCPYGDICKHIASVLYYLRYNDVPELESVSDEEKELTLSNIYKEMNRRRKKLEGRYGTIEYDRGDEFVDLINDVSDWTETFINNKNYEDAFNLIKHTYKFIKETDMDGSDGEYQESFNIMNLEAALLIENQEYYDKFKNYLEEIIEEETFDDLSDYPVEAFILYAQDEKTARQVLKTLDEMEEETYIIVKGIILDKITITHDYIDKDKAINMCYENIDDYRVEDLLRKYLKEEGRDYELIKLLEKEVKSIDHSGLIRYRENEKLDELLDLYDKTNNKRKKKELLEKLIINGNKFNKYLELKSMYKKEDWEEEKEKIISKLKENKSTMLIEVYQEEKDIDSLYNLVKDDKSLYSMDKYQDLLKTKYNDELLKIYKKLILEESCHVSDRSEYNSLAHYIGRMQGLNNSEEAITDLLQEMRPNYSSKRAFKEEILSVLKGNNKLIFNEIITHKEIIPKSSNRNKEIKFI